jgi:hypothetical protein
MNKRTIAKKPTKANDLDDLLDSFQTKLTIDSVGPSVGSSIAPTSTTKKASKPRSSKKTVTVHQEEVTAKEVDDEIDDLDEIDKLKICSHLEAAEEAVANEEAIANEVAVANEVAMANEEGEFLETIKMNKDFVAEMDKLTSHIQKTVTESVGSNLDGMDVLSHLGNYVEEPYAVIESYFEGQHLERLVRHQLESYNNFVNYQMQRTIEMFNPITIMSDNDYDEKTNTYGLVIKIYLKNLRFQHPQIHENNGATKIMMPQEARLRNFTYSSNSIVDLNIEFIIRNENGEVKIKEKQMPKIKIYLKMKINNL